MGSFSITHWIIFGLIVWGLVRLFSGGKGPTMHCLTCGVEAPTERRTSGSIVIEVILWICFIVPGLIYSIWRLTTRRQVCSSCGSETIIPVDSPAAQNHRRVLAGGGPPDVPQRKDEYGWMNKG